MAALKFEQVLRLEGDYVTLIVEEHDSKLEEMDLTIASGQIDRDVSIEYIEMIIGGLTEVVESAKVLRAERAEKQT